MSDHTAGGHFAPVRTPRAEFRVYHAIIFLVALPLEMIGWTFALVKARHLPESGPLSRAARTADEITPLIFWP